MAIARTMHFVVGPLVRPRFGPLQNLFLILPPNSPLCVPISWLGSPGRASPYFGLEKLYLSDGSLWFLGVTTISPG